jgi:hypothetical protein
MIKVLAGLVIVWGLLHISLLLMLTRFGLLALFFGVFAGGIAFFCGAILLVGSFLYPQMIIFAGLSNLLLLLALAAAASTLFLLFMEGPVIGALNWLGIEGLRAQTGFAVVHGLATAMLLVLFARLVPGVELATTMALVAGLIGAFVVPFFEKIVDHTGTISTDEMALLESSSEDEEEERRWPW